MPGDAQLQLQSQNQNVRYGVEVSQRGYVCSNCVEAVKLARQSILLRSVRGKLVLKSARKDLTGKACECEMKPSIIQRKGFSHITNGPISDFQL